MAICAAAIGGRGTANSSPLKVNGRLRTNEAARKAAISPRNRTPTGRAVATGRCSSAGTAIGSSRKAAPESPMKPSQKVM